MSPRSGLCAREARRVVSGFIQSLWPRKAAFGVRQGLLVPEEQVLGAWRLEVTGSMSLPSAGHPPEPPTFREGVSGVLTG